MICARCNHGDYTEQGETRTCPHCLGTGLEKVHASQEPGPRQFQRAMEAALQVFEPGATFDEADEHALFLGVGA
jgi:hypothetical protein